MATPLATAFIRISPDSGTFRRDAEREASRAGRQAGEQFEESFDDSARRNDRSQERGRESGRRFGGAFADSIKVAAGIGIAKVAELAGAQLGSQMQGALDLTGVQGEFASQLNLSAKESARVGAVAGKLFAGAYGENMQEVQAAITGVIKNIDGMGTASSAVLEDIAQRAIVTGGVLQADVGDVTKAVSQLMRTGLAPNAKTAFDLLNAGASTGKLNGEELLEVVQEYSTQFRRAGLDGKTAFTLLSQGMKGGARDVDQIADAIGQFGELALAKGAPVVAAFKSIGLNADDMAKKIGGGGPTAKKALGDTLNALRGTKDQTVKLNAATALFGDPGTVMGDALFALDPSAKAASKSLGNFTGITDKANKAVGDTAKSKLTAFKNSMQVNVTSYLAREVIPKVESFAKTLQGLGVTGSGLASVIIPLVGIGIAAKATSVAAGAVTTSIGGIKKVAGGISNAATATGRMAQGFRSAQVAESAFSGRAGTFGGKLRGAFDAGMRGARSFATAALNAGKAAGSMALSVGRAALAHTRAGIAAALNASRTLLAAAAQRIAAVATRAWAIVQAALNVVMSLNPIALVVLAIGALIAIVVLAYKRSHTFKNIVDAAFRGIAAAGKFMWNTVLQPIFKALQLFITKILVPYFKMWWNIAKAVFSGIAAGARSLWNIMRPIFVAIRNYIVGTLMVQFRAFQSVVRVVWNAIRSATSGAWNFIGGVLNRLKSAIGTVGTAFQRGASAIKSAWSKIQGYTKTPVNFVIGTVYNNGIRNLWNKVMGWLHLPSSLQLGKVPLLESGGPVPAKPNVFNRPTAIVGEGRSSYPEYVIPTDPKYRRRARGLWAQAGGGLQMMASGGILGVVKRAAGKAVNLGKGALDLLANPGSVWDRLVSGLPSARGLATSPWGTAIAAVPPRMLKYLRDHAMALFKAFASSFGGDGTGVVKAAINMIGRGDDNGDNYNWLTRMWGMPGAPWCAMFVSEAIKQANAGKHYRGYPSAAVASYNAGMRHVNVNDGRPGDLATYGSDDHINIIIKKVLGGYDTVGGNQGPRVNRYVRGGQATVLRPMASGGVLREVYRQRNFDPADRKNPLLAVLRKRPKALFDDGGWGTGWPLHAKKKEAVFTERQFAVMETLAARGAQPSGPMITGGVHLHDGVDVDLLESRLAFRQTGRRL